MLSPAGFAIAASEGAWKPAKHLLHLNRQLVEVAAGRLEYLVVTMPPRHGKSEIISRYTPAWFVSIFPDKRVILTSYEADFAAGWGDKARKVVENFSCEKFGIKLDPNSNARSRWDLEHYGGGMSTAGAGGSITGKGSHLLIIDDPIKNDEEAMSEVQREHSWSWFRSVALTRMEPNSGLVLVQTRWHQYDLAGRLIEALKTGELCKPGRYKIVNFPALAVGKDILGRKPGEALWPERYPREKLLEIKSALGEYWFSALYQGEPVPPGGKIFKRQWFVIVDARPARIMSRVRYWDKASTLTGDWTVGTLMSKTTEGAYYIEDVVRGRWTPSEVEQIIKQTAKLDGLEVKIKIEQEPGSAGKANISTFMKLLVGFDVEGVPSIGKKELRWNPVARQAQVGNILLVRGHWNAAWLDEMENAGGGKYDDQADSASGAFLELVNAEDEFPMVIV